MKNEINMRNMRNARNARMNKKLVIVCLMLAVLLAAFSACKADETKPLESGKITQKNVSQVGDILREAGLSNVDVFEQWVKDAASSAGKNSSGFSDANCRMTVMLLAGDAIRYDSVEEAYDGTYLMFDVDAMENDGDFSILKDKQALFTTMFGEMPIPGSGFADALPELWKTHGIRVEHERCSVISILFKAYKQEDAFVGHTGLLIDCSESDLVDSAYVFVEKIAFGEPFTVTLLDSEEDLIDLFSARSDYSVEEGDPAPVVYKNDETIGTLKR